MRRFVFGGWLLFVLACRRPSPPAERDAGSFDAGPPFPQSVLPSLPPGTRVIRSGGYQSGSTVLVDDHAVYWTANREFRWLKPLTGRPPLGINIADLRIEGTKHLADPLLIQPRIAHDAEFIYALQDFKVRKCEMGHCEPPSSTTDVLRISKKTGASTRIATLPDWIEALVYTGGRLLLAGAISGKLWELDLADDKAHVVAQGLASYVAGLAAVHSTLYVLSVMNQFYDEGARQQLATLPLPVPEGAIPRKLEPRGPVNWIAGGDHLYASIAGDPSEILRFDAEGRVDARLYRVCPNAGKNAYQLAGVAERGSTLYWLCSGLGEGYLVSNDAPPWEHLDAGAR